MKKTFILFIIAAMTLCCFGGCGKGSESVRISLDSLSKNIIWDAGITPVDNSGEDKADGEEQGTSEKLPDNSEEDKPDGENAVPEVPENKENEGSEDKDNEAASDNAQNNSQTSKPSQSQNSSQSGNGTAQKPAGNNSGNANSAASKPSAGNSDTTTQKPSNNSQSGGNTTQEPAQNTNPSGGNTSQNGGNQNNGNQSQSGGNQNQSSGSQGQSSGSNQSSPSDKPSPAVQAKTEELEMLKIINERRAEAGAKPLTFNYDIYSYAQTRAEEISEKFEHTRPNGESALTYISTLPNFRGAGENISYGNNSAAVAMEKFMNSEGHRNNIINPNYTSVSIGLYIKDGVWYFVQLFWK